MSRNDSLKLKGVAIIMMFWHHLFGCGDFLTLPENKWFTILGGFNDHIGWGLKLCIAVYAFVSGYALYISYFKNNASLLKRLGKFLITYWTMLFIVAVPYFCFTGKFSFKDLLISLFAVLSDDNSLMLSFSWYVKLYLMVLFILPIVKKYSGKIKNLTSEIAVFIILPLIAGVILPGSDDTYTNIFFFISGSIKILCRYYPIFHAGIIFGKYSLFDRIFARISVYPKSLRIVASLMLAFISVICRNYHLLFNFTEILCGIVFSLSVLTVFSSIGNKYIDRLFEFLGNYSFQYWLLSGMFFLNTAELQWILYIPQYAPLIMVWSFLLLTPFAILLSKISDKIIATVF